MFFDLLDRRIYSCMHRHTVVRLCMHPCLIYKDCPCCICCGKSACVHLKVCMYALSCMWCCTHVHIAPVYLCTDTHGSWATVFLFLEGGISFLSAYLFHVTFCPLSIWCLAYSASLLSLYLCCSFSCPVSVLCVAQAHPILMVTCLSVALENLPGILPPSSCLWVFEPGWLRLIGGQSRQHERKLCAGATGGNMEQQCAHWRS